jgi:hypothetical protein
MGIAAVSFKDKNGIEIVVYPQGEWDYIDFDTATQEEDIDLVTYKTKNDSANSIISKLDIATSVDGKKILRLRETATYTCRQRHGSNDDSDLICRDLTFQNEKNNKFLKVTRDRDALSFRFINYLGRTHLKNAENETVVDFEIVPQKMDYEEDYIELTKKLAEECAEILLEYSGVTSNRFELSEADSSKTLLEQFIFLREFCYSHNLQALFGSIKRNPDRILMKDEELKPIGQGAPSSSFYSSPFSHSRGWQRLNGKPIPQEIAVTRKYDSLDTVANRFVKFALKKFNLICRELCASLDKSKEKTTKQNMYMECYREAFEIERITNDILRDRFFDDVGELTIMPQNNQVLEKREGYRQIFSASAMVDLALQLNWEGEQEVYNGESKNTALLYEYWLFFELRKIVCSIKNCKCIQASEKPFINTDNGLTISLSQGQTSCQSFVLPDLSTRVNLYYNRTFSREEFSNTKYAGSYSKPFRPDYTLEVFPADYLRAEDAVREGSVSYIHFDAKYRITDLRSFIGTGESDVTDEQIKEEVEEDKQDSITNTYKHGDLLKMHTYNDAIRRTVGSFVLYPGEFDSKTKNYRLFEEVLPGVGAFAIKPSILSESENVLKNFITEIIITRSRKYSRLNRLLAYSNRILGEPAINELDKRIFGKENDNKNIHSDLYAIGYLRPDYYEILEHAQLLEAGKSFIFYYYAIKGDFVYSHHEDIAKAKYFRFYRNDIGISGKYEIQPFEGVIISRELVSKKQLDEMLTENGCNDGRERTADFYYVNKVEIKKSNCSRICCKKGDLNGVNGNDTFSPHSPKVVTKDWLQGQTKIDN